MTNIPPPEVEQKIQLYKAMDTLFGLLDTSMRTYDEVVKARYVDVRMHRRGIWGRGIVCVGIAVAAIPALYNVIPESIRGGWAVVVVVVAVGYLVLLFFQHHKAREDEDEAAELLPKDGMRSIEFQAQYILTLISAIGTRLQLVRSILASNPPASVKEHYEYIESYWKGYREEIRDRIEEQQRIGALVGEDYSLIKEWLDKSDKP